MVGVKELAFPCKMTDIIRILVFKKLQKEAQVIPVADSTKKGF